jgi:hypothetical protein
VIPATEAAHVTLALHDQGPPVRANVGHAPEHAVVAARQEQRLVEASLQQREGEDVARSLHPLGTGHHLPAASEDPLALALENGRIPVDPCGRGRSPADLGIDAEVR